MFPISAVAETAIFDVRKAEKT